MVSLALLKRLLLQTTEQPDVETWRRPGAPCHMCVGIGACGPASDFVDILSPGTTISTAEPPMAAMIRARSRGSTVRRDRI
jgi:hypothetical protein